MKYIKCPTCGETKLVEKTTQVKGGTIFYSAPAPVELSAGEELAMTLAGEVHRMRCPACQDLYEMHGITG